MSSSPPEQTAVLKEILEALKALQMNQVSLASNVDAISGRVNVLAGMKEVHDVASTHASSSRSVLPMKNDLVSPIDESETHDEPKIPESPSLSPTHPDNESIATSVSHVRKSSTGTSRIILTWVLKLPQNVLLNLTSNIAHIPANLA
jgi:hypothetical protein